MLCEGRVDETNRICILQSRRCKQTLVSFMCAVVLLLLVAAGGVRELLVVGCVSEMI